MSLRGAIVLLLAAGGTACGAGGSADQAVTNTLSQVPTSTTTSSSTTTTIGRTTVTVHLAADEVVPGPGDADLKGTLTLTLDPSSGQVCTTIDYGRASLDRLPNAQNVVLHLASGTRNEQGDSVIEHRINPVLGGLVQNKISWCQAHDLSLVAEIVRNRASYYSQVTTSAFPDGAIRGQLG